MKKEKKRFFVRHSLRILFLFLSFNGSLSVFAQTSTTVVVRAKAKDAKFIGTGIGGAFVIIRNNTTGEILAKGYTKGASGNTDLLMKTPITRNKKITDEETAKFEANLSLDEPVFADIEVIAPYNRKSAAVKATSQVWLIPGKNITGDGIILEIPGFIVDILAPQAHQVIKLDDLKQGNLPLQINIVMMCGCVINKGGVWNSDDIEVNAIVRQNNIKINEVPLSFANKDNTYAALLPVKEKGSYEIVIYAYDKKTGNTGVDKISYLIN